MSALDDAARELHQEGYEEGCNDGYRKALDDILESIDDPDGGDEPWTAEDIIAQLRELRRRAR